MFYGQSWISGIGPNRRRIKGALYPEHALMFDDGRGVKGWCGKKRTSTSVGYCPATELERRTQSVQIPYLFRRAALREQTGTIFAARSEGVPGASIGRLSENPTSEGEAVFGFDNLVAAIGAHVAAAEARHLKPTIPYVVWCQGAGDARRGYKYYRETLTTLMDRISSLIVQYTGQATPPVFLILQPPGRARGGDWKCLQVLVDMGFERDDCVLATTGWAFEQYDRVHFSGKGAVMAGELLHLVAQGLEAGDWVSAPFLMNYRREGAVITAQVGGPHDIIIDESLQSPRHWVGDNPVPNYGFTAYGAEIEQVLVEPRKVTVKIDRADGPVKIGYAWHEGYERALAAGTDKNQSANRGTLRADWSAEPVYGDAPLFQWLASGFHKFEN